MSEKLFVYGTLGPGRPNAHILEDVQGTWAKAYVNGHLVNAGWGARAGYPALRLDRQGVRIDGFLLSAKQSGFPWADLDAFEGAEYKRVQAEVFLHGGESVRAHVYVLNESD